jgi:hypothetical protein
LLNGGLQYVCFKCRIAGTTSGVAGKRLFDVAVAEQLTNQIVHTWPASSIPAIALSVGSVLVDHPSIRAVLFYSALTFKRETFLFLPSFDHLFLTTMFQWDGVASRHPIFGMGSAIRVSRCCSALDHNSCWSLTCLI